ncbi:hypothetical protein [Amycolatopsis sp. cg9]|uniref:hypothetical protein n=1 Tax=Amycolatopsis sp. cg9 TaxID=3238801 RepID=UPI003524031D
MVDGRTLAGVDELADDTELVVDSFSLAWLQHSLRAEHGIELDLREVRAEYFSSLTRIRDYVNDLAAARGQS